VTSAEAYGANTSLIVQFFGIQQKGQHARRWAEPASISSVRQKQHSFLNQF
jgi:putative heme degradation protein